mmetsp:Transcript_31772/g.105182  ORF Transcript_31772/g.105182 Transcript_31772/m.105182 type:complete len:268 (+) Transcript_31772:2051-2854(+)
MREAGDAERAVRRPSVDARFSQPEERVAPLLDEGLPLAPGERLCIQWRELTEGWAARVRHAVAEPADRRRSKATQRAALAPPHSLLFLRDPSLQVRLTVADVDAQCQAQPEAIHHLIAPQPAPAERNVAFVLGLIPHHRLDSESAAHDRWDLGQLALQADMRNPCAAVVVEVRTVVDRFRPAMGVFRRERLAELVPDGRAPVGQPLALAAHIVPLVGQRPPDVGEGAKPRNRIFEVEAIVGCVVRVRVHPAQAVEAPPPVVVGVEED